MPLTSENWLLFLSDYGIVLVFFGALFEGETIIILAGVLSHQSVLPFMWTICAAIVGAFTGDQTSFYIGRRYGTNIITRFPRAAQLADSVRPRLTASADWVAFSCRFVYGTRIVAPMSLGANRYSPKRFALINLLSVLLWAVTGVSAGYLVGSGAEKLLGKIEHLEQLLLAVLLAMLGWWWYRHRKFQN
ncbi:MAG TPA: DedA family protein [Acidiferrobacteraceae bacterium]|nr:DedA family protein [Acidiferrobacteraceae bacterium]HEX19963.1 DedA family protein [Acidiferrobacteraceae bacterium]